MSRAPAFDFTQLAPLPQPLRAEIMGALAEAANARASNSEGRILRSDERIRKVMRAVQELQRSVAFQKMMTGARLVRGDRAVCEALAKRAS